MQPRFAQRVQAAGAALVAAGLVGCGGGVADRAHPTPANADREWIANASGVIDQLDTDVSAATPAGRDLAAARRALRDESDLYGLLVAYTDFGGCSKMIGGIGEAPERFSGVLRELSAACGRFERGATLFTRAASQHDARALLAASHQVKSAAALLYRAVLRLAAARTGSSGAATS